MKTLTVKKLLMMASFVAMSTSSAMADDMGLNANLSGFNEVPAISTKGAGVFTGKIVGNAIQFTIQFNNLAGNLTKAHLHFSKPGVDGGAALVDLCTVAIPTCPSLSNGSFTGSIQAVNIVPMADRGFDAADNFAKLVKAIKAGATYINLHTDKFPKGELRGQVVTDSKKSTE